MINIEYIWLDLLGNISFEIFTKLKEIYIDVHRIYLATYSINDFKKSLIDNNILIPKETFQNMVSIKFKEYCMKISKELNNQKIYALGIMDKEYPYSLRGYEHAPIVIYLKDSITVNVDSIKSKFINMYKIYMLENKNEFNKEILGYVWTNTINKKKKRYLTSNSTIFESNCLKNIRIEKNEYVGICKIGDIELYILNKNNKHIDKEKLLLCIIDGLILARVSNIEKGLDVVDFMLEEGRDVFAVPGNILYKENYLANHVIKQGAYVVTNRYDMKNLV